MFKLHDGSQFEGELVLVPLPDGKKWKLYTPFRYDTDCGYIVNVPKDFVTDLASIPRILWNILPPFGKYSRAVVVHDYLYAQHRKGDAKYSRAFADAILLEALADCECGKILRGVIWLGVRVGGWAAWNGKA